MGLSRKLVVLLVGVASIFYSFGTQAQTWNEIFKQKKTQKKYLIQQIAALEVYIGYARKGYEIVGDGLHLVRQITGGEFSLHKAFFASLGLVNASVSRSPAVAEILDRGLSLLGIVKSWKHDLLNESGVAYVSLVKSGLLAECASELEDLLVVITSGKLEMSDDERLGRLEALRLSMEDKYGFALSFSADLNHLVKLREREQYSIDQIRRWYEIE